MLSTLDKMWKINTAFVAKVIGFSSSNNPQVYKNSNTSQTDGRKKWHHHQEKRLNSLRQWGSHSGLIQIPSWDEHFGESGDSDTNKHPTPSFCSLRFFHVWPSGSRVISSSQHHLWDRHASGETNHTRSSAADSVMDIHGCEEIFLIANQTQMLPLCLYAERSGQRHHAFNVKSIQNTFQIIKSVEIQNNEQHKETKRREPVSHSNTLAINDQNKKRVEEKVLLPRRNSKVIFTQ